MSSPDRVNMGKFNFLASKFKPSQTKTGIRIQIRHTQKHGILRLDPIDSKSSFNFSPAFPLMHSWSKRDAFVQYEETPDPRSIHGFHKLRLLS